MELYTVKINGIEVSAPKGTTVEQQLVDADGNKVEAEVVDENGNAVNDAAKEADADKKDDDKEKEPRVIYYVTDEQQQSQYINMFKAQKMEAFIMNHNIDVPFMQQLESKNEGIRFQRIDADLTDTFKSKTSKKAAAELEEKEKELSEKIKKALKNDKLTVKCSGGRHNITHVIDYFANNNLDYDRIYSELPTLNDVFLEITGKELRDSE